jgi:hypothetical protein
MCYRARANLGKNSNVVVVGKYPTKKGNMSLKDSKLIYVDKNGRFGDAENMYLFSRSHVPDEDWSHLVTELQRLCDPFLSGKAGSEDLTEFAYEFGDKLDEFRALGIEQSCFVITKDRELECEDILGVGYSI